MATPSSVLPVVEVRLTTAGAVSSKVVHWQGFEPPSQVTPEAAEKAVAPEPSDPAKSPKSTKKPDPTSRAVAVAAKAATASMSRMGKGENERRRREEREGEGE
jgi:hypothetical protein